MQNKDWSADYRVFEKERIDGEMIFGKIRHEVISRLPDSAPLVTFMDDTLMRKKGRKVSGTAWKRDPNGPKFCNNFIWVTRFLQISGALEEEDRPGSCRGIPFMLRHCPTPKRPSRKAPAWARAEYEILKKEMRSCTVFPVMISAFTVEENAIMGNSYLLRRGPGRMMMCPGQKLKHSLQTGYTHSRLSSFQ